MDDEGIDEVFFKKANGGWLFKLSSPYIIGQPAYFVVTQAQKAAIARKLRSNRAIRLAIVLPGILLAVPAAHSLPITNASACTLLLVSFLIVYALIAFAGEIERQRLRPLIHAAPRARGRITLADQFLSSARCTSFPLLLLLFAIFAANFIVAAAVMGHRDVLAHAVGLIIYGSAALYFGALAAAKLTMKESQKG
jgi:hypothetical protein